jgi:hypothetical protein
MCHYTTTIFTCGDKKTGVTHCRLYHVGECDAAHTRTSRDCGASECRAPLKKILGNVRERWN